MGVSLFKMLMILCLMIYWLVNNECLVFSVNCKVRDGFFKGSFDEVDEK